jgi:hypothetical protein
VHQRNKSRGKAPCAATSCRPRAAPATLGVRVAPRPRPHTRRGAPSPRAHASRHLGVRPAARLRDRAVLAGCAPRTVGPTAALPPYACRPRARTTASMSCRHPFVTRGSAPIKPPPFSFPTRHWLLHPAISAAAGAPPPPAVPFTTRAP